MHAFIALKNLRAYIRYRQRLGPRCPHCRQELGFMTTGIALPPSPPLQAVDEAVVGEPRLSTSANSTGEGEGDMLIMKS